jgi:hypothetical protein
MKKAIATAKRLWDKYIIRGCHLCLQRGVTVRTANSMLSGIVSILVSMLIHTFWKASITTLNPRLIGSTVQPRRRTIVLVYTGKRLSHVYSVLACSIAAARGTTAHNLWLQFRHPRAIVARVCELAESNKRVGIDVVQHSKALMCFYPAAIVH